MSTNLTMNLTNTGDGDFTLLPVGRYKVEVDNVYHRISENGNTVFDIDLLIRGDKYNDFKLRLFQTITENAFTKDKWTKTLKAIGVVLESDFTADSGLVVEFIEGDEDDRGRTEVIAVKVGDTRRTFKGKRAFAEVVHREDRNDTTKKVHWVDKLVSLDSVDKESAPAQSTSKPRVY